MTTAAPILETSTVRFERLLPGPIERVWDYLVKPELRRTWLPGRMGITDCSPLRTLEYALPDSSVVRFDLERRGDNVLLRLSHRRLPGCIVGVGMTLLAGVLFFILGRGPDLNRQQQYLGAVIPQVEATAPPS